MNYIEGAKLVPSVAEFSSVAESFVASKMQHKVSLSKNIYGKRAVNVVTRDGIRLKSTPSAIALYDAASGESAIIATLTNSFGVLVESNKVVYPNSFNGLCADVVYSITKATFEQDVVIAERLDSKDYGFPPETTHLLIYTELFDAVPEPDRIRRPLRVEEDLTKRQKMVSPDVVDEVLGFGEFVLTTGRAATLARLSQGPDATGAPVAKRLQRVGDRLFLIESVEYSLLMNDLLALPECQRDNASLKRPQRSKSTKGFALAIPRSPEESTASNPLPTQVASAKSLVTARPHGVVIDYTATIGSSLTSGFVFQGDTTYLVTGPVICNGSATIEGGAVIKYKHLVPATASIKITGSLTCKTSRYRPGFFTAVDDDSVGETMNGYAGSGYVGPGSMFTDGYANPALWFSFNGSQSLNDLRFRYCQEAVRFEGTPSADYSLWHSQLVNCIRGIVITGSGSGSIVPSNFGNVLFSNVISPLKVDLAGTRQHFHNCTIDNSTSPTATTLVVASVPATCAFTNSVVASVTATSSGTVNLSVSDYNGFFATPLFGSVAHRWQVFSSPFLTMLSGKNYLPLGSSFADQGISTGLPGTLGVDLARMTTAAPLQLPSTIAMPTVLYPSAEVPRDVGTLDLGYHYAVIDDVMTQATLSSTLTLKKGVAIATSGSYGASIQTGGNILCEGLPTQLNVLTSLANVQDQPGSPVSLTWLSLNASSGSPQLSFRFTDFSIAQGAKGTILDAGPTFSYPFSWLVLRDSMLRCSTLTLSPAIVSAGVIGITNNVLDRCNLDLRHTGPSVNSPLSVYVYNNLFYCFNPSGAAIVPPSTLTLTYTTGTSNPGWQVRDNLFDKIGQSLTGTGTGSVGLSNNGFTTGTTRSLLGTADQTTFTVSYLTGALGSFYLPSTAVKLIDLGSRTASLAGLYHYATRNVANNKELATTVDIGFHYVGVGSNNQPIDTDGDGAADYLEDNNGNQIVDNTETNWNLAGDLGLWVKIVRPTSASNLP